MKTGNFFTDDNDELVKFSEVTLFEDKIKIMLPDTFIEMPAEMAQLKYPSENRPQIIRTSLDTRVNFTFSLLHQEFAKEQIEDTLEQFRQIIKKVNPAFLFFDLVVEEEKDIGWFDFKSYGLDEPVYNVTYVTPVEKKLLYGVFNCAYRDIMEWKDAAHQMILSITDCTKEKGDRLHAGRNYYGSTI